MRVRCHLLSLVATLSLLMFFSATATMFGQSTNSGTVVGTVTDQTGAVVAGATVTLTDTATKIARTDTTNDAGRYVFVDVNPGNYELTVSKQGFSTAKTQTEVKIGNTSTLNMALQVGGANVVVEVTTVGTELQTMNATVGNTLTANIIDNLPALGREVNTFIELQPGVAPDGSVGGAVVDQTFFSLDGGNNSNDMDGSGGVYQNTLAGDPTGGVAAQWTGVYGPSGTVPTPQDSVEEFKVNTAGQTADFNSSAGAEVKVVTKRGTDAWHGTAYEYYKDNNWSSNSWQNDAYNVALPSFHYNRYGGAIGGPLIPKDVLGGKTYFFFNYEGFNWPSSETIYKAVPSAEMRLGIIQDSAGNYYNLNPYAVTNPATGLSMPGTTNDPNGCPAACMPLGITPLLNANANNSSTPGTGLWDKYMPLSNSACNTSVNYFCDGANVQGFSANLRLPQKSKFFVGRLDHDFSKNWHFMTSYRYFNWQVATDSQVDIGGFFSGDTLGVPTSLSTSPQEPWYFVAGLTTNISPNVTNDFHYSLTRNWWAYIRKGDVPQFSGLGVSSGTPNGAALEVMSGEDYGANNSLAPYNVNNQQTRNRFWDGHDNMVRDDLSMLHGNHLFQFGGIYQHNFNWHRRTDNGGFINNQPVYDLGEGGASGLTADIPLCGTPGTTGAATAAIANCGGVTAAVLGMVTQSAVVYTRTGAALNLLPVGTPAQARSTIPYYNVYFIDTWHLKPTWTVTYGLGYALEMPPTEAGGQQVTMVDQAGQIVSGEAYLHQREAAALQGINYNPEIGYALIGSAANSPKYPYNPYYGELSPRIAFAWSPKATSGAFGNTVVRAGYGRQYGRLNGVSLVLVPLLAPGILQPVDCTGNLNTGTCATGATASDVFRVGPSAGPIAFSGLTAPLPAGSPTLLQPYYPGFNAPSAGPGEYLDPNYRPNVIDAFNVTVQRQLGRRITLELGYIGRRITHEYQPVNLNAVPYMMTAGGQQFQNAYANVVMQYCGGVAGLGGGGCAANASAVQTQPFFENALKPSYCQINGTPTTCTAAVVSNEGANLANAYVWSLWSDLDGGVSPACVSPAPCTGQGFVFGNTMMNTVVGPYGQVQSASGVADNMSIGHGNYNAGFVSVRTADWKGITLQSNFTWSKALGTGAVVQASSAYTTDDPFDLNKMYGIQPYNRKFVYNTMFVYQLPFYKGQHGLVGRALGGWTIASIFTAGSGTPVEVLGNTGAPGQAFGAGDAANYFDNENEIPIGPLGPHGHAYYQYNTTQYPTDGYPVNFFKAGTAEASNWRNPILGFDTRDGGAGWFTGLPYWNLDASVKKSVRVAENVSLEFQGVFADILNHNQWLDPYGLGTYNPGGFGALGGEAQETPGGNRQIELGARVRF
jgi:hypothetical protein